MKKNLTKAFIFLIITISITSCENNFSPIVNYKKNYALNCIIRGDTSLQYATIIQSFGNENFNKDSAFVSGALLKLNYDGKDYFFKDTTSGGADKITYYFLKNFKLSSGKQLKIEANLLDGTILNSSTQTPDPGILVFGGANTIPPENSDKVISIHWNLYYYSGESLYYRPFLYIEYKKNINGSVVYKQKEVPVEYNLENNNNVPVYPKISMNNSIVYSLNAFNAALTQLEESDTVRNYNILNAKFVLWVLDKNLAAYLLSTENFQEDFSLRIEAADFTNVQGGFGIFGSFLKYEKKLTIQPVLLK